MHQSLADHSILSMDAKKTPGVLYVRYPYHHCSTPKGGETLLHKLTQIPGRTHWEGAGVHHPSWFESVKLFSLPNMSTT